MIPKLAAILACPVCKGEFAHGSMDLACRCCARRFRLQNDIPILLDNAEPIMTVATAHESNALGAEFEAILASGQGLVLHLGAGSTARKYSSCVELERKIFRHTDVVADAHALPFREQTFDHVMAFNLFEHLENPRRASAEVWRVLKPRGSVVIHTAFLQPLHEAPFHFYNATEYGVRSWFKDFEVETCRVSPNFTAPFMLGFLLRQVLESVEVSCGKQMREALGLTTLRDWADFWSDRSKLPPVFGQLQNLPSDLQCRVAAGFELVARKP